METKTDTNVNYILKSIDMSQIEEFMLEYQSLLTTESKVLKVDKNKKLDT